MFVLIVSPSFCADFVFPCCMGGGGGGGGGK